MTPQLNNSMSPSFSFIYTFTKPIFNRHIIVFWFWFWSKTNIGHTNHRFIESWKRKSCSICYCVQLWSIGEDNAKGPQGVCRTVVSTVQATFTSIPSLLDGDCLADRLLVGRSFFSLDVLYFFSTPPSSFAMTSTQRQNNENRSFSQIHIASKYGVLHFIPIEELQDCSVPLLILLDWQKTSQQVFQIKHFHDCPS